MENSNSKGNGEFRKQSTEEKGDVLKQSSVVSKNSVITTKPSSYLYTINCKKENACAIDVNPKSNLLACGLENSEIHVWNLKYNPSNANQTKDDVQGRNSGESLSIDRDEENCSIARSNRILKGHQGSIYGVVFSLRHDLLLSCSEDSCVRAWSIEDFNTVAVYSDQSYPVWDITLSTNGAYFATASMDFSARLWSFERSDPLRIYAGHSSSVDCVKFHSNSRYLATTSDKVIQLWTTEDSRSVRSFTGHDSYISCIAFSPNGQHLTSADDSGCIKIWDLGSGKQVKEISAHAGRILSIAYSKNSSLIASGGFDTFLKVWDAKTDSNVPSTNTSEKCNTQKCQSTEFVDCHSTGSILHYVSFRKKELLVSVATSMES